MGLVPEIKMDWIGLDLENGRISNFQRHVTLTLTLDRAIMAYHRTSLIDLYLHTKLHSNQILWTDGHTYILKDGQTSRPALLGRLRGYD